MVCWVSLCLSRGGSFCQTWVPKAQGDSTRDWQRPDVLFHFCSTTHHSCWPFLLVCPDFCNFYSTSALKNSKSTFHRSRLQGLFAFSMSSDPARQKHQAPVSPLPEHPLCLCLGTQASEVGWENGAPWAFFIVHSYTLLDKTFPLGLYYVMFFSICLHLHLPKKWLSYWWPLEQTFSLYTHTYR